MVQKIEEYAVVVVKSGGRIKDTCEDPYLKGEVFTLQFDTKGVIVKNVIFFWESN